jgi:Uma2 family endonuclease
VSALSTQETKVKATIEDLYHVPENGKAEIVNGELVMMSPTGDDPSYAASEIFVSLRKYARRRRIGRAVADNAGFHVDLPNRQSLSPDAAFYIGPRAGMRFFEGAPVFAVEIRSEGDYGPHAERKMAQKRADYFAAGTLVVWDVDLLSDDLIKSYTARNLDNPMIFRRGERAKAEPAVPGWSMSVDDLFPQPFDP